MDEDEQGSGLHENGEEGYHKVDLHKDSSHKTDSGTTDNNFSDKE